VRDRQPREPDRETLPAKVAERLLARASELDATGLSTVTQLRAAATEAGISSAAFDAALAELRNANAQRDLVAPTPPRRSGIRRFAAGITVVVVGLLLLTSRRATAPDVGAVPMHNESLLLRCISAGEAAEMARSVLDLPRNSLEYANRRLTVHGTSAQIAELRATIDRHEATMTSCTPSR
jgi:hypothetical protein